MKSLMKDLTDEILATLVAEDWLAKGYTPRKLFYYPLPMDYFRPEGYWYSAEYPHTTRFPTPVPFVLTKEDAEDFLLKLDKLEVFLKKQGFVRSFLGTSDCRICGCENGSKEFYWQGWVWPFGYRHYVEEHWVAPSEDFRALVEAMYSRL